MAEHLLPGQVKIQIRRIRKTFRERRKAVAEKMDEDEEQSIVQYLSIVKEVMDVPEHYELVEDDKLVEPTDEG